MLDDLTPFIEPALIYGIGALGLALIYRYLRFPDLTVMGSVVAGGIATVFVANRYGGAHLGLIAGFLAGGLFGMITGVLRVALNINPVLSGVISLTASFSFAHLLTTGGVIKLDHPGDLLSATFAMSDLWREVILAGVLCLLVGFIAGTKPGALLLAMGAESPYRRFRHRYQGRVFTVTVALGNSVVGLAGGLYALNDSSAYVPSHIDFLPLALAGVFFGNAITSLAAKKLHEYDSEHQGSSRRTNIRRWLAVLWSVEGEQPHQVAVLFGSIILGSAGAVLLARSVQANVLERLSPRFTVDSDWQYLVVALALTLFAAWSGKEDS